MREFQNRGGEIWVTAEPSYPLKHSGFREMGSGEVIRELKAAEALRVAAEVSWYAMLKHAPEECAREIKIANDALTHNRIFTTVYRNGEEARILCMDAPGHWPIKSMGRCGTVRNHLPDGRYVGGSTESIYDLV